LFIIATECSNRHQSHESHPIGTERYSFPRKDRKHGHLPKAWLVSLRGFFAHQPGRVDARRRTGLIVSAALYVHRALSQIETPRLRIANVTKRLRHCCRHVTGACTLLDKVGKGMVAKPRS
jgi:hypothetical protein